MVQITMHPLQQLQSLCHLIGVNRRSLIMHNYIWASLLVSWGGLLFGSVATSAAQPPDADLLEQL